jgi:hypothetical protein
MVDLLAITVAIVGTAVICGGSDGAACPMAVAFAAGFVRGYGDAQLDGKSGQQQFNAGIEQGTISAALVGIGYGATQELTSGETPYLVDQAGDYKYGDTVGQFGDTIIKPNIPIIGGAFIMGSDLIDAEYRYYHPK